MKARVRVKSRAKELNKYLEDEAELGYQNLKKAEEGVTVAMKTFVELLESYHIDKSHFEEVTNNYDKLFVKYETAKQAYDFKKLKKLTVYFEILTAELDSMVRNFESRYRRLIAEAASAWNAADENPEAEIDE